MRLFLSFVILTGVAIAQTPTVSSVVNGFSFTPALAPGGAALIFGRNLATGTQATTCPGASSASTLATTCAGVSVTFGGKPAAMIYVLSTQLLVQVPFEAQTGPADVVVQVKTDTQTLSSAAVSINLSRYAPAVATSAGSAGPAAAIGVCVTQIGSSNPAHPGDRLSVYATGLGPTDPAVATGAVAPAGVAPVTAPVKVTVGGKDARVDYAGLAPGMSGGQYQVTFQLAPDTPVGVMPLVLEIGGVTSQPGVTLDIAKQAPTICSIRNAASGSASIAAGTWIAIYGAHLSSSNRAWSGADFAGRKLPLSLDGVSAKVNGIPAAVYYVSDNQVNLLSPLDSTLGQVKLELTNSLGTGSANTTLARYSPAFFTFAPDGQKYVAAVHVNGDYVGRTGLFGGAAASRPAQPGETILLFGNGFGPTNPPLPSDEIVSLPAPLQDPSQLTITIGGLPARVDYAGLTIAGVYQFNVVVPIVPDGDQTVVATIGGTQTQTNRFLSVGK
jgi:uncharacterized protein (TIGR03437 family)